MNLANKKIIYDIDNLAVKNGINPLQLMENAGSNAARIIDEIIPQKSNILIVCGKGHNGGDGYVVARHLFMEGHNVSIFPVQLPDKGNDPTYVNFSVCKNTGIKFVSKISGKYTVIIDAILGVGIKLPLRSDISKIIKKLNRMKSYKIAIDLPTGIDGDTGETDKNAFLADLTVTMEIPKIGMYVTPAKHFCGKIKVARIGIPGSIYNNINFKHTLLNKAFVEKMIPIRDNNSNKSTFGKVLAIGGSVNYSGAITFSSQAAIRAGAGLIYTAIPDSILSVVSNNVPDAIKLPLKSNIDGTIAYDNSEFLSDLKKYDALLIGPGIGTNTNTKKFILNIIENWSGPLIIDADALRVLPDYGKKLRKNIVITPHPGEAAMLLDKTTKEINSKRLKYAKMLSDKYGCTVLLKGYGTIITDGKQFYINSTGNHSLARGGSGDILSGMILAFLGNGIDALTSAAVGAYIHGLAGDLAGEISKGYSVSMKEIIDSIPGAFKCIFS